MENGFDLLLVLVEPSRAPYFSASCMIYLTQASFPFRDIFIVEGFWGSSISRSSDVSFSGEGAASTFLGGTSSSYTSSCQHFLDHLRVASSSNVTSLLISMWWNPRICILWRLWRLHSIQQIFPSFWKGPTWFSFLLVCEHTLSNQISWGGSL